MLSYQGNIVLLESEEMQTADLRRTVLAVAPITHNHRECFETINNTLISLETDLFTAILINHFVINIFSNLFCLYLVLQLLKKIIFCSVSASPVHVLQQDWRATLCIAMLPACLPPVCQWRPSSIQQGIWCHWCQHEPSKAQTRTQAEAHLANCGSSHSLLLRHTVLMALLAGR